MTICFLNGQFLSESAATLSSQDRGFLLGDGLFETVRCYAHQPFALDKHWQRLTAGAQHLQIPLSFSLEEWKEIIQKLIAINNFKNEAIGSRLTLTRGIGPRGLATHNTPIITILITVFAISSTACPVNLAYTLYRRNERSPLSSFKTLNYLENIAALQQAYAKGFEEAILINTHGEICSASCANLYMVHNEELYTPSIMEGALPGVTRHFLIAAAEKLGIKIHEQTLNFQNLFDADEVFLTNSLREIQKVRQFEQTVYQLTSASITNKLHNVLGELILNRL